MDFVFWISAAVIAYVYAGYPLLLAVWARVAPKAPRKGAFPAGQWPSLSVIVAARNEAARLPARIENLLDLPYEGAREIIVVSDGSTDRTEEAIARYVSRGDVRFIAVPAGGKPVALNAGVAAARGDILVFADARQQFAAAALIELASNFADPEVGGATGELVLDCESGSSASSIGDGVGAYWKYEKWLRRHESRIWSTLGATGAIYALRRALWRPLPADTLLDDVLTPMRAVLDGWRVVFEADAMAEDWTAPDGAVEARRKRRTLAGNYQILAQEPRLLIPVVNPVWLQYVSHKVGRLVVPWALIGLFASSVMLARDGWTYALAFAAQAAFYALAALGAWLDAKARHDASGFAADLPVAFGKEAR